MRKNEYVSTPRVMDRKRREYKWAPKRQSEEENDMPSTSQHTSEVWDPEIGSRNSSRPEQTDYLTHPTSIIPEDKNKEDENDCLEIVRTEHSIEVLTRSSTPFQPLDANENTARETESETSRIPEPPLIRSRRVSLPGAFRVSPPGLFYDDSSREEEKLNEEDEEDEVSRSHRFQNLPANSDGFDDILLEATLVEEHFKDEYGVATSELVCAQPLEEANGWNRWFSSKSLCLLITSIMILGFVGAAGTHMGKQQTSANASHSSPMIPPGFGSNTNTPTIPLSTNIPSQLPSSATTEPAYTLTPTIEGNITSSTLPDANPLEGILSEKTRHSLKDPSSPQSRAYKWIKADPNYASYSQHRKLQRFGLATFYFAAKGEDWIEQANWLSYKINECDWFSDAPTGLVCSDENYSILSVNQNANMTGMVPDEMWLPSLVSLTLVDHDLHGTIPTAVGKMLQLENLALYDLFISSSIPSEIGNVKGN